MKSEGQVRHKLQQVTYRHLQRAIRTKLSRRPENCTHNRRVKLPVIEDEIRYCHVRKDTDGDALVCDECYDGLDRAAQCPAFECAHTKDGVKADFTDFLRGSDVATIAAQYPDLAALLWTLDDADPVPLDVGTDPDPPKAPEPPSPPYQILYLHQDGGAVPVPIIPNTFHRAVVHNPVTFTLPAVEGDK